MIKKNNIVRNNINGKIISVNKILKEEEINYQEIIQEQKKEKLITILEKMLTNRLFDEEINQLVKEGVPITHHSNIGQEASQTVAFSLLEKEDYGVPNHRGWGWAIGKGLDLKKMMSELMGKKNGYCRGKGGAHLADRENNLFLRVGIQGAYASLATGIGLGLSMQKSKSICMCLFGDGSSNAGYVHEGMNIAATNKLPVIFFCENNLYALFTPYLETTSVEDIADRAIGYGMPGFIVDGMDAMAVIKVVSTAIDRARKGEGPTLIEAKTYRYFGHTPYDKFYNGIYRSKKEIEVWRKKDPIDIFLNKLISADLITMPEFRNMKEKISINIRDAVKYAQENDYPEPKDYLNQVYNEEEVIFNG